MALIVAGMGIPRFKRGSVFGNGNVPMTTLCLGFITFIKIDVRFVGLMDDIVASGVATDEYIVKHSDLIKKYKDEAFDSALESVKCKYEDDINYFKKSTEKYYQERNKYYQEVSDLKTTLKTLVGYRDE